MSTGMKMLMNVIRVVECVFMHAVQVSAAKYCKCDHETIMKDKILTPRLCEAWVKGLKIITLVIFPLVQDIVHNIWVVLELATIFNSVYCFSHPWRKNRLL